MKIIGTGSALPEKAVTNDMLSEFLETDDKWIRTRTGIEERRVLTGETIEELAVLDLMDKPVGRGPGLWVLIAGFLAAYITGTLACRLMIKVVNRGKLIWFAVYCSLVGLTAIGFYIF